MITKEDLEPDNLFSNLDWSDHDTALELARLARMGLKYEELKGAEEIYQDVKVSRWAIEKAKPALEKYEQAPKDADDFDVASEALEGFPK